MLCGVTETSANRADVLGRRLHGEEHAARNQLKLVNARSSIGRADHPEIALARIDSQ